MSKELYTTEECTALLDDLFECSRFGNNKLRRMDTVIDVGTVNHPQFHAIRIYEQNQKKNTDFAKRARAGERIAWAFKNGKFFMRFSDSEGAVRL